MLSWEKRPAEIANLLNPAFCSVLLRSSIDGFQKEKEYGISYPLLFLVLPLVLHAPTRQTLPKTTQTKLHVWLQNFPEVRVRFVNRTRELVPYTKEALIFGLQTEIIAICNNGNFIVTPKTLKKPS